MKLNTLGVFMSTEPCVYVIEEEPAHSMLLSYHIEKLGFTVKQFESATAFFSSSPSAVHYVIASDNLSDMDNLTFCTKIKDTYHQAQLLITTTSAKGKTCTSCQDINHIYKPFSIQTLYEVVSNTFKIPVTK